MSSLSEADTAKTEFTEMSAGTTAELTSVNLAGLVLRGTSSFIFQSGSGHSIPPKI